MNDKPLKNPFNYTGGKYKLLPQILPLFPQNISNFVDLFCGGGDVFLNTKANKIFANDSLAQLIELNLYLKNNNLNSIIDYIDETIKRFDLKKEGEFTKENYLEFRDFYNKKSSNPLDFYIMICYSFSNQIRFNNKGEFNLPSGINRSYFNPSLRKKLIAYISYIKEKDIIFSDKNFENFDCSFLDENSFVYIDPPYLLSTATYNENNLWNKEKEENLLSYIDNLNSLKIKFMLSNLLESKGKVHPLLETWANKNNYKISFIKSSYKNVNYHRENKNKDIEVVITNY